MMETAFQVEMELKVFEGCIVEEALEHFITECQAVCLLAGDFVHPAATEEAQQEMSYDE